MEPAEGLVLSCKDGVAFVQTFDAIGHLSRMRPSSPTGPGFLLRAAERFAHMLAQPDSYRLGPADRLAPVFGTSSSFDQVGGSSDFGPDDALDGGSIRAATESGGDGDRAHSGEQAHPAGVPRSSRGGRNQRGHRASYEGRGPHVQNLGEPI